MHKYNRVINQVTCFLHQISKKSKRIIITIIIKTNLLIVRPINTSISKGMLTNNLILRKIHHHRKTIMKMMRMMII